MRATEPRTVAENDCGPESLRRPALPSSATREKSKPGRLAYNRSRDGQTAEPLRILSLSVLEGLPQLPASTLAESQAFLMATPD